MAESATQELNHPIYPRANSLSEADGVAWVLTDPNSQLVQYAFKFPALGDNDVRAKILHTGLCASDHLHGRAKWGGNVKYPCCMGHEVVGQITAVGSKVTIHKVGDIVGVSPQRDSCDACTQCQNSRTQLCLNNRVFLYDPYFGGYATHIQIADRFAFAVPEGMPLDVIPPLLCAGVTVYAPIKRWSDRNPDRSLKTAVISIGGLGHLALQYLKKLGYHVTALTTSLNREAEFKALGADDVQHSHDPAELAKQSQKYDYVISTNLAGDENTFKLHTSLVARSGVFTIVGVPDASLASKFDIATLVMNQISVEGSLIGSRKEVSEMLKFSAENKVYPVVEKYAFQDFNAAFEKLEKGRPKYRCVVNVTDWAKENGFDK